jgi:hypothetical protein
MILPILVWRPNRSFADKGVEAAEILRRLVGDRSSGEDTLESIRKV